MFCSSTAQKSLRSIDIKVTLLNYKRNILNRSYLVVKVNSSILKKIDKNYSNFLLKLLSFTVINQYNSKYYKCVLWFF